MGGQGGSSSGARRGGSDAGTDTTQSRPAWLERSAGPEETELALAIAWAYPDAGRVGEVARLGREGSVRLLGRGEAHPEDARPRLRFGRERPSGFEHGGPLEGPRISRDQLRIHVRGATIDVSCTGRCPMIFRGEAARAATLAPGDLLLLEDAILLLCVRRGRWSPMPDAAGFPFGHADPDGFVGESPAAWELRDRIAFVGAQDGHVLLLGESGAGKELAARAVHARSRRRRRPLVSRNAATLPEALIDAELFGHARDYPNAGMPERAGLVGEAEGGTLFLDEIGELSEARQAHLLRLLDGGEYQRLGDPRVRRADVRIVAATNRDPSALKHDLRARFKLTLRLPGLNERPEDVPLLIRELVVRAGRDNEAIGARFFEAAGPRAEPRLDPRLVERLVAHPFTHHVRELEAILWKSLSTSERGSVALTAAVAEALSAAAPEPDRVDPSPDQIREALRKHRGNQVLASRELGLTSRHVLYRLMKKHGLGREDGAGDADDPADPDDT